MVLVKVSVYPKLLHGHTIHKTPIKYIFSESLIIANCDYYLLVSPNYSGLMQILHFDWLRY